MRRKPASLNNVYSVADLFLRTILTMATIGFSNLILDSVFFFVRSFVFFSHPRFHSHPRGVVVEIRRCYRFGKFSHPLISPNLGMYCIDMLAIMLSRGSKQL